MLAQACPDNKKELGLVWKECQELSLIFGKITSTLSKK